MDWVRQVDHVDWEHRLESTLHMSNRSVGQGYWLALMGGPGQGAFWAPNDEKWAYGLWCKPADHPVIRRAI